MTRVLQWIWKRGIVSTFLAGLFAILPLVITLAIISWVVTHLHHLLGPTSFIGRWLQAVGLQLITEEGTEVAAWLEVVAWAIGLVLVLVGVWALGVLMKSAARRRVEKAVNNVVDRIPIVKSVYSTASQLVAMLKADEETELEAMSVVFCSFGQQNGGGVLCLLATAEVYRFGGQDYHLVYMPTSPLPMTGGIILVPTDKVEPVEMTAEQMMRIYFSMGILSPQVVPRDHVVSPAAE